MLIQDDGVLLTDWTWIALDYLLRCRQPRVVRVFRSRAAADHARRSYGRGARRDMQIARV